jgi:hypothetical protein
LQCKYDLVGMSNGAVAFANVLDVQIGQGPADKKED